MNEPLIQPEVKRDRYGRYLLPHPDAANGNGNMPWTRATTFAKSISDSFGLTKWQLRMAVKGLATRPDLFALAASAPVDDKATLDRVAEDAKEAAGSSSGANSGTALHTFTERVDRGEKVTVPPPWNSDVTAYTAALDAAGVTMLPEYIERIVVVQRFSTAGTFDRICRLADGRLVIADLKTGKDLSYGWLEIAVQLALYANADAIWNGATGEYEQMPNLDRTTGLVMHLPVGKAECTLYEVDLALGWEAAQLCDDVRRWRKRKGLARPIDAPTPALDLAPDVGEDPRAAAALAQALKPADCAVELAAAIERGDVLAQISLARSVDALVAVWEAADARGTWTDELTAAAARRKAQLSA